MNLARAKALVGWLTSGANFQCPVQNWKLEERDLNMAKMATHLHGVLDTPDHISLPEGFGLFRHPQTNLVFGVWLENSPPKRALLIPRQMGVPASEDQAKVAAGDIKVWLKRTEGTRKEKYGSSFRAKVAEGKDPEYWLLDF